MKTYVLASGSKGNSTLVCFKTVRILIDAGINYSELKRRLKEISYEPSDIDFVFITHDHSDHIKGLEVFLKHNHPVVYVSEKIANIIFKDFHYDKVNYLTGNIIINDVIVRPIALSHDSTTIHGYVLENARDSLVYITDTGYIHMKYYTLIRNKECYIIESNHDLQMLMNGKYPDYLKRRIASDKGHICNKICGKYLSDLIGNNTKSVVLAHLSEENNTPQLALSTVKEILKENNIQFSNIKCASQDNIVKVIS